MFISIKNLNKFFNSEPVLKNINLSLHGGHCYALLGRNGAGKSTLLNLIVNLIEPDSGSIEIQGLIYRNNRNKIVELLGIVSEGNPLINEFSGKQYLEFIGLLRKISKIELYKRIKSLVSYFFEDDLVLNKIISSYSTGMKKKIALCGALLHRPDVLILDEPFSGLDVIAAIQLIDFFKIYLNERRIIIISSHDLSYIEKVATHLIIINEQKIAFDDSLINFTENGKNIIDKNLYNILAPKNENTVDISWLK